MNGNGLQRRNDFPLPDDLEVPPEWNAAAGRFLQQSGPVMVLGAPDAGKSTLCRYLVYRAYAAGHQAALVDLDLGQSHLGPPATLGLGLFPPRRPGDEALHADGLHFIGQTSPVGAILEVAVGSRVLVDLAVSRGCTRLVINTSGLVQGSGALILKRAQVELLRPALILGLARDRELEPLLRGLGGQDPPAWPLLRLPVSFRALRKTTEARRAYREERFHRYFQGAGRLALPWRSLVWDGLPWGHGDPLAPRDLEYCRRSLGVAPLYGEIQGRRVVLLLAEPKVPPLPQILRERREWNQVHWLTWPAHHFRLVGLLDGRRRTLGLGLILPEPFDPETLALLSPLADAEVTRVRFVKVGKIRLNLRGQELNHV